MIKFHWLRYCCALCIFCGSPLLSAVEHPLIHSTLMNAHQTDTSLPNTRFNSLEEALYFYQQLDQQVQWPQLKPGPLLRQGDRHSQVMILRQQLMLLGDYRGLTSATRDEQLFDSALHQALLRFQRRHGAKVDGILGPQSRQLLNMTPSSRIQQLHVNQQRIKQFKSHVSERFIQVNIPEFKLRLINQGDIVLQVKTIVGREERQTPEFTTDIKALLINPSWTVPKSIGWKDIIPAWQLDPDYLEKKNLNIAQGLGEQRVLFAAQEVTPEMMYSGSEYRYFWEAPGPGNTLGRIKFMSHSRYAIYLHDTSAQGLFKSHRRDFSSGCIRVEQANELAQQLLRLDSPWQLPQLQQTLTTEQTQEIYLKQPVPVHITYWTAWVDQQGILHFRDDIYHRDP
ncbi:L,D-transpeptidase family protein [Amphritea sp. 1_MG-2023]|uniref:L,D-transpeptidase family protein n=1 Tax=Amphritea sp. 1_MG-2023 TaxID=3062670 RepID=UPI0026E17F29|nr:L,D-transpeptidase family protein [Amphritea sp. 1_MG-2023]MDO6561822.1 L,D-transpeptidase family protein [Amphritea sp. 1_MG-2023]